MKLEKEEKISRNLLATGLTLGLFALAFPLAGIYLGMSARTALLVGEGLTLFKLSEIAKPEAK